MTKKRNGAIDFWRFVFATLLVVFHAYLMDQEHRNEFPFILGRGAIAVEFFLLTSGFLMAASVNREPDTPLRKGDTWRFLRRKISGFYPAFVIAWAVTFIAVNILNYKGLYRLVSNFFYSVFELTLLRNAGFTGYRTLAQTWYLSAMIIAMFVLYPLYRSNKKRFEYYIAPAVAMVVLGYLFYSTESLVNPNLYMSYGFKSTYRAFGEICLGVVCYVLCEKLRSVNITRLKAHLLSVIELFGYGAVIYYMQCYKLYPDYFDFVALFFLAISVIISFSGKSSINRLFNHKIFYWLGRFSLYPYLMFILFAKILPKLLPTMDNLTREIIYIVLTFVSALVLMWIEKPVVRLFHRCTRLIVRKKETPEGEGDTTA